MGPDADKNSKIDLKELGLVFALIFGRYFFHTEDLHYGLWTADLALETGNLRRAQEQHSELIISKIPDGVKSILDVGCGVGALAARLSDRGYRLECLTPSRLMAKLARENLRPGVPLHICRFEQLQTEPRFDLVLFSESFQYVEMEDSIPRARDLLADGGYLLICDFFKTDEPGHSPLSGGHRFSKFNRRVADSGLLTRLDLDITRETAPNLDLIADLLERVAFPLRELVQYLLESDYPRSSRVFARLFRKKLDKLNRKYFSHQRNADSFARFKTYRLLLLQKPVPKALD